MGQLIGPDGPPQDRPVGARGERGVQRHRGLHAYLRHLHDGSILLRCRVSAKGAIGPLYIRPASHSFIAN